MGMQGWAPRRRMGAALAALTAAGLAVGGVLASGAVAQASDWTKAYGTPCSSATRACVDIDNHTAWLLDGGKIVRGPVLITSGAKGEDTPRGNFQVQWKDKDHRTSEFNNAPMPYAVFFAAGGIAFHEGSLDTSSAGCVHLDHDDAAAFYDYLAVGDAVEVH